MLSWTFLSVLIGACFLPGGLSAASEPAVQKENSWNVIERDLNSVEIGDDGGKGLYSKLLTSLENIIPAPAPNSVEEVISRLKQIKHQSNPKGYVAMAAELISQGLATNDLDALITSFKAVNKDDNINKMEPKGQIYPKKSKQDAPYSQKELAMRRQIFIPSTFTYGKKPPVILVPGTGERGGNSFAGNFLKTLDDKSYADIVWINPPGYQLADAQVNAETVAYAINYISGISGNRNVSTIGWSQGSISMQWALKYWPSTRKIVSGVITFSGDYHGTIVANILDPLPVGVPLPPSILQQKYTSNFAKVLKSNGGDSAYVPTTTIYSSFFDEVVEPQNGKQASAYLMDARGVGVSNNDIQKICPRTTPAGSFVDHESNLFNALTFALVEDALKNGSPGRPSRIDLKTVCEQMHAPGLSLDDLLTTESTIPFAVAQIALYNPKVSREPAIKPYAQ